METTLISLAAIPPLWETLALSTHQYIGEEELAVTR